MKNYFRVILALFFLMFFTSSSFADNKTFFVDGKTLVQYYASYTAIYHPDGKVKEGVKKELSVLIEAMKYVGYVMAVNDTFPATSTIFCVKEGVTSSSLASVVGEFLIKHPEKWEMDAAYIVAEALSNKYECKAEEDSFKDFSKQSKKYFY